MKTTHRVRNIFSSIYLKKDSYPGPIKNSYRSIRKTQTYQKYFSKVVYIYITKEAIPIASKPILRCSTSFFSRNCKFNHNMILQYSCHKKKKKKRIKILSVDKPESFYKAGMNIKWFNLSGRQFSGIYNWQYIPMTQLFLSTTNMLNNQNMKIYSSKDMIQNYYSGIVRNNKKP